MDFEVRHADGTTVKLISSEHKCAITSATQTRKLCGNDTVTINLQSATYIDFYVGDKITIFGTTYTLNQLPTVKKESERSYTYTLVFEGLQYTLIDRVFLMPDNTQGDNLMFDLAGMLRELATNINRGNSGKQYEFVLDNSLEETEYKNLSLTGKNCLQVLQQLCQEWDTEFVFAEEPTRIAIYIGVAGSTFPTTFKYGRGGGVYELNREKGSSDICTRLFVYGGTQNLTYYRHNRLCLPSKEKNQSYVEDATAQAVYGIKEQVKNFDDIYPNRIGTITSLSGCDYNEFIDSAMADAQYGFDLNEKWANNADDCAEWLALKGLENTEANRTIYYNDVAGTATKYLMAGATAKIHFNTGALAGYECDLHSYTHSSQKFVLKPLVDENGYDFPSKTNAAFKLAVGDEYVILDINLPTAYKTQAESKLATEAASYFATVCRPQPKYTLTIEPIALKHIVGPSTADTEIFKVGDLINVSDPTGGVESATIRIDQFVRNLLDPFDYKLTLTDEITYSQQVRTLIEVDAIKRVVEESKIYDVNRIRRGWKDAEELYNQMFDTEGHYYSEKIAPLSIDTQMLKVGARSQQLVLQNVLFQPNYNANPANLQISAGSLVHYTIAEPDIKTWTMSALSASNVPSTAQYVYAKCAKNGTKGTWLVTDQAIIFDSDPSYYHFLVGSLSSVDSVSNTRNFAATYGYTTINGRYITTGVIKSSDTNHGVIIDLDDGEIIGKIKFRTSQGTDVNAETYIGETAASTAKTAVDNLEIGGRNLLINSHIESSKRGNSTELLPALTSWASTFVNATNIQKIFKAGETYTISFDYEITAIQSGKEISNKWAGFGLYSANDGWVAQLWDTQGLNTVGAKAHFVKTFTLGETLPTDTVMNIYTQRYSDGTNQTIVFSNLKVEKGNKATDWSPAPEDTDAAISAVSTRIANIDSNGVFSVSEKQAFRTEWYAISGIANTTSEMQSGGTAYKYYNSISNTATNTRGALNTAFSKLRLYLKAFELYTDSDRSTAATTETYNGTTVVTAGTAFSKTTLSQFLAAYYQAEMNVAFYSENVSKLTGTCSTAAATATKVVVLDNMGGLLSTSMAADMLTDSNVRIRVTLEQNNTSEELGLSFKLGTTTITPTGRDNSTCYFLYQNKRSDQKCFFLGGMVMELIYNTLINNRVQLAMADEENFATLIAFNKAMQGTTTVKGGLILTETIVAGEGTGQAGMSGENASGNVAFWAGGQIGSAQNFGVPVVIMRDGQAKFGLLRVSKMGDITMPDDNGYSRFSILNKAIPTVGSSAVLNNSFNYTNSTDVVFTAETTSQTEWQDPTIGNNGNVFGNYLEIAAIHAGAPLTLQNSSGKTEFTLTIDSGVHCFVSIYLRIEETTDHRITNVLLKHIDNSVGAAVYERYNYDTFDNEQVLLPSGRYLAKIVCVYNLFRIDSSAQYGAGIAISGFKFRANAYHDATVPQTTIGNNGLFVNANATNYLMVQSLNQVLTFKLHGDAVDIPGVLWAGEITSAGGGVDLPSFKNANVTLSKNGTSPSNTSLYNFKYTGISGTPIIIATPKVAADNYGWSAMVESLSTTNKTFSVRIKRDNSAVAAAFHLIIIGTT